ncbi:MAG TPA: NAD(P)/FAD-dependent oxidoreductase [Cyclobacteriaceae bacterium]|jgi:2-polyprenyl-6-methoxyphenol hydroxylase-like FAD-dependent oxidoreductase|nr:NAD(P)/FAD-dependent oxidoreductase [Cyclobacteriaceae bacterium]
MLFKNKKVAIIGGGPGGLTLARLLQLQVADVKVFERDKDQSVRQQGATLDLHEDSGLLAIRKAGLLEEFKKLFRPGADIMRITDSQATILLDGHLEEKTDTFGDEARRPEIDRGPLRDLLINSLQEGTIVWNSKFTELKPNSNGWDIHFENGNSVYADLVIAADGDNSKIRKYITDIQPIYSGVTIVEGNIYNAKKNAPKLWELTKGGKVFAMGGCKTIILSAKGEGSLSFYTGTKENEDWVKTSGIDFEDKHQVYDWFKLRFADWSNDWHELFETDESYFVPRPQYHFPLDQHWKTLPNLTMLGDAAHRMPPYAGEGVNQAMKDALELAEALTESDFKNAVDAIASFEKKMCERASEITQETLENTERMHSENSLKIMLEFFTNNHVTQE